MSRHKSEQSLCYKPEECTWVLRPPGKSSSGIYRLSRFSASSEAGKAKQLQAGLRVHIRTTRPRELQCSRSLAGEGECIFMCCCQDQEVEVGSLIGGAESQHGGSRQERSLSLDGYHSDERWSARSHPKLTDRLNAERKAANAEPFTNTHTHSHSHKHINTLELPFTNTFSLSLFWASPPPIYTHSLTHLTNLKV